MPWGRDGREAGAFAYEPEKCVPGLVPGLTDGPESGYCDSSNCTQCCNANCELVTCNNCAGCSEQCVKQAPPQIINVDITCQGGVDCIMCNCPLEWSEGIPSCVERVLKKQLKIYVSRTPKCRLKSRLRKVNLYWAFKFGPYSTSSHRAIRISIPVQGP
ncbi:hypothetical protein NDN08_002067 [Rhodosorus marinus]|uniref:4Fe-4S ferredoxin-type domain-containing protein n=1 Tax=Rhodosorus marinus TaxID=101924 RepID=A0AAV8USN0_9RHOD|nr:hypothetical protein NDN08_002067 [Rhodosorus marinus]